MQFQIRTNGVVRINKLAVYFGIIILTIESYPLFSVLGGCISTSGYATEYGLH